MCTGSALACAKSRRLNRHTAAADAGIRRQPAGFVRPLGFKSVAPPVSPHWLQFPVI